MIFNFMFITSHKGAWKVWEASCFKLFVQIHNERSDAGSSSAAHSSQGHSIKHWNWQIRTQYLRSRPVIQLRRNCAHHFLEHIYLYVSNVWWFLLILGTSRHWPHQLACLQWSFTTPHYHPRYPPSRSPHPTQATPSLCPLLLLLLITEMTINLCYDAQKYVENHDNAS